MRILLAHAKSEEPAHIRTLVEWLQSGYPEAQISTSAAEYRARLGISGSVDQLMLDLGAGRTLSGQPLFNLIVCPRPYVGKRTQRMIHAALRAGREVTFIEDDDLISVGGIKEVDPEDWIAGWQLVTKE